MVATSELLEGALSGRLRVREVQRKPVHEPPVVAAVEVARTEWLYWA